MAQASRRLSKQSCILFLAADGDHLSPGVPPTLCSHSPSHPPIVASMARASQVLEQSRISGGSRSYAALAEEGNIPLSTLHHRGECVEPAVPHSRRRDSACQICVANVERDAILSSQHNKPDNRLGRQIFSE